jgi:DNA mismatch repair protein MutS2
MDERWFQKASEHLEWPRLQSAVLARCLGASARRRGLSVAQSREQALVLLRESDEAMALLERGESLPFSELRDIGPHLSRLARQGALSSAALADVLITLQNARALRGFLSAQRERAPALLASCGTDPSLDALESELRAAIEPDGTLSDAASPQLKSLRTEIGHLRERIIGRLEQVIERFQDVLSDRYYTLREGRYVVPVRRDAHERVMGIVHATSESGASIFVEPRAILAHGNRLKMAESELEREQERVLAALSERTRDHLPSLEAAVEALDRIDLRHAGARLGRDLRGCVPELCSAGEVALQGVRHPLLALDGIAAVPNPIELRAGQGLVISGPNASGKTVLLKALGLAALMVRHGLPVAAERGSRIPYFERVLTDVGDEQSTVRNLSTFSAHITNLTSILESADGHSLVLLDEVATGTDPQEGAALACAIVDAICARGAALAVSTHYEPLKAMSLHDPRLRSASVGFDIERMEPTFALTLDVPGVSSALLVAKRFGLPQPVLDFAQRVLPEQARDFERLVTELGARSRALQQEQAALAQERAELRRVLSDQQTRLDTLRQKGDAQVAREVEALRVEVRTARGELERARAVAKTASASKQELADADKRVAAVAGRVALGGDLSRTAAPAQAAASVPIAEAELREGVRVHIPRLRSDGVVVEGPTKGRVRVAVGPLKLWVESHELLPAEAAPQAPAPAPVEPLPSNPARSPDNTLNVKGMRVDDALSLMESFVDRMYTTDARVGYVVHGHGTGALREAVRKHLKTAVPLVRSSRPAQMDEGGDGVTVFYL